MQLKNNSTHGCFQKGQKLGPKVNNFKELQDDSKSSLAIFSVGLGLFQDI